MTQQVGGKEEKSQAVDWAKLGSYPKAVKD